VSMSTINHRNNNLDGLRRIVNKRKILGPIVHSVIVPVPLPGPSRTSSIFRHISRREAYLLAMVFGVILVFGLGMMTALNTPWSGAEKDGADAENSPVNNQIPLSGVQVVNAPSVSNEVLFSTPIGMLQDFFSPVQAPDMLAARKEKLKRYLQGRGSPFAEQADFIAEQPHWKLILAISFAESTMGKRCYYNNCSGIGGSNIRTYPTLEDWISDFNRLLEKRYKDQTLEQMCGVYVQPCNPNWLLATRQILNELKENGIE